MADFEAMKEKVISGDANGLKADVEAAVEQGVNPQDIIDKTLVPGMRVVGEKFEQNEFFVPELLIAARAMETAMTVLTPLLAKTGQKFTGTFILGTVRGDLHDIGKNLVAAMFKGAGFKIVDLGVDVSPEKFAEAVKNEKPDVLGMSALLTTTMPSMRETIKVLENQGIRGSCKVLIGGAPINQAYADEIGADGYAPDANSAVTIALKLIGKE